MTLFGKLNVTGKLMVPFMALAAALVAVLAMGLWATYQIHSINAKADHASREMILASEVRALSRAIQRDAINTIFDEPKLQEGFLKSIAKRSKQMIGHAKTLDALFDAEDAARMKGFLNTNEVVVREINATTALAKKGDKDAAYLWFRQHVRAAERAASKLVDTFIDDNEKRIANLAAQVESTRTFATILLLVFGLVALAGTLGAGIMIVMRAVVGPVRQLADDVHGMAQGEYTKAVAGSDRSDEIGAVAKALDQFRGDLAKIEQMRQEQEASQRDRERLAAEREAERKAADDERQRAAAEDEKRREEARDARIAIEKQKEEAAAEQAGVLRALADGLSQLADGNLTYRIEQHFPDSYVRLKEEFNATLAKLQETMAVILNSTHNLNDGSGEIARAADDLSQRTERQAASLEETASALRGIMETVRQTTERTTHATDVVNGAQADANDSSQVMRSAVAAMSEIEQSVKQIAQIIGVIDEIAFQTNLLALNAGVEAARAGEVGRGFAVVASEVRSLAQRSADAAKEIKSLINVSTKQTAAGVDTIGKAGETITRVVGRVDDIRGVVLEIANASRQQEGGLHDINSAVTEMDQVTQQNAAMVEQTTAASHSLAKEATHLATLMGSFRIAADTSAAADEPEAEAA